MDRGFVILAQNTPQVNYIKCAEVLAGSIKRHMPNIPVSLITDDVDHARNFDSVIALPYGDLDQSSNWKLINDWQVYEASPYEHTIKVEADMFFTGDVGYWFDDFSNRDVNICTTIRNFRQEISKERFYRRFIDDNRLPDTYNALTYFRKSARAHEFFNLVRTIFENWDQIKSTLKCNPAELATTDWVYALAAHILGRETVTLPGYTSFSMVHMKQAINGFQTEDWTDTIIHEALPHTLRILTQPQLYPVHYHVKHFAYELEAAYG